MIMEHLIHGVMIGSLIAFVALGYALIYSILRFVNFAHGEVMTVAAYVCYLCVHVLKVEPFAVAVLLSIIVTGLVGVFIEKLAYKPIRSKGRLALLLSSLGLSIVIQAGLSLCFGSSPLTYGFDEKIISIANQPFYEREILVILGLILLFIGLNVALKRSRIGIAVRSISSNPTRALLSGVPIDRIISIVFFVASALAAAAGISVAIQNGLTPSLGFQFSLWAFAVAVIAGLGSIRGILIAGLLFGLIINFAIVYTSSLFANSAALVIMAVILLVRPKGLFVYDQRSF